MVGVAVAAGGLVCPTTGEEVVWVGCAPAPFVVVLPAVPVAPVVPAPPSVVMVDVEVVVDVGVA